MSRMCRNMGRIGATWVHELEHDNLKRRLIKTHSLTSDPRGYEAGGGKIVTVLDRMQLTLNALHRTSHDASRLVLAMAWSVKTRRSPSRRCRDARVYGLTDYGHV